MAELSTEQVLLLNQLMYMSGKEGTDNPMDSVDMHVGETVGEWLGGVELSQLANDADYGSYMTGSDWKNIIAAVQNDPTISNMTITASHTDWADGGGGGLSAIFTSESTGEAVVAFRGTAGGEWKDNFVGGNVTDTAQQQNALNWYQDAYKEYGLDRYQVTVTGHSKGGNKCKYITVMDGTVDRCLSFDGQGFSDKFMDVYADKIAANQWKIQNHNVDSDYVNILLNDVGETTFYKGFELGKGGFLENHCPNTFMKFGENGEWSMVVNPNGQDPKMAQLNEFFNSYLRSMPDGQRTEALEMVNALIDDAFSMGEGSREEAIKRFLNTLTDSKYSDDAAYLLAYTIRYEQENPGFENIFKEVLSEMGMEEYCKYIDIAESVLNYSQDFGPVHLDFNTLMALATGVGESVGFLARWIPGFSYGTDWAIEKLHDWILEKTGMDLSKEEILKLIGIVGMVSHDLEVIRIPANRKDKRVASTGGPGKRIRCEAQTLRNLSNELNSVRSGLSQTSQSVRSAGGNLPYCFLGAGSIKLSMASAANRIARLEESAGRLAAALDELAALYEKTESQNLSSAGI